MAHPPSICYVTLFGSMRVWRGENEITGLTPTPAFVLASVALADDMKRPAEETLKEKWPSKDKSDQLKPGNVRQAVSTINKLLGHPHIIFNEDGVTKMEASLIRTDVNEFRESIRQASRKTEVTSESAHRKATLLLKALSLHTSDGLLPDFKFESDSFLYKKRIELREQYWKAMAELAMLYAAAGRHEASVIWAKQVLNLPDSMTPGELDVCEAACKLLLCTYVCKGIPRDALQVYNQFTSRTRSWGPDKELVNLAKQVREKRMDTLEWPYGNLLLDDLPLEESKALDILSDTWGYNFAKEEGNDPGADTNTDQTETLENYSSETLQAVPPRPPSPAILPRGLTSFIGRDKEVKELKVLLGGNCLLTLTGTGGIGKTRLAFQLASSMQEHFPDGVWLVELESLMDPALIPQKVASLFGIQDQEESLLQQALIRRLDRKRTLLVLDNCEHLHEACATLVTTLLRSCSDVKILATSRVKLSIYGEQVYRVPSLNLPDSEQSYTPERLREYAAIRLFVDRALLARHDLEITPHNTRLIANICHRLDGIPLAIELAAARTRSLSVEQINTKLVNRFQILTGGNRSALPRRQTLRALIDWSYDLLNLHEKALLCRLSVFAGGWTLTVAEAVVSGAEVEKQNVMDLLTSLVDWNFVAAELQEEHSRYRMSETIREYARERLEERGERDAMRERHQAYFLYLAEEAEPHLRSWGQLEWLDRLEAELDNFRAALEWQTNETSLRLAGAFWQFWYARGYLNESKETLNAILDATKDTGSDAARAKALNALGAASWLTGKYSEARPFLEESVELSKKIGDVRGIAAALGNIAGVTQYEGNLEEADRLYQQALQLAIQAGDNGVIATQFHNFADFKWAQDDLEAARDLFEQGLDCCTRSGNLRGEAYARGKLGDLALSQHEYKEAWAQHKKSLEIRSDLEDRRGIAYSLKGIAALAAEEGNILRAAKLWGAAEALREKINAHLFQGDKALLDKQVSDARSADKIAFDAAKQAGRDLLLKQAVAYALQRTDT